ncbi:hypothetical protein PGTUg99_017300 [Puccinia graminis f. sp. tritici]|uniref:Uncharacterized protein n=1 Tax=Puccinia graminis f. sp. tritici TaxID=56615 RepID=A0A5B0SBZ9_PUCGR|nr:hypothetical protein PGTUg99_017300 [Puccinia graminis f. sp. tritici]
MEWRDGAMARLVLSNQNQDPVNPDGEVKLKAEEVKPKAEQVKLQAEEVKPEAGEVKLEAGQVKLEAGQSKLEAGEFKLEAAEINIELGATALNADHSEVPTVKTEAPIHVKEVKPDGKEAEL